MPNWPALLVAPSLALTNLSITYALVTPSCARQSTLAPQLVSAAILLACLWMTLAAWRNWRAGAIPTGADVPDDAVPEDAVLKRRPFVALVAAMTGALSCLVVLAQWFPVWVLSPCAS